MDRLKRFWEATGGRLTSAEFEAAVLGGRRPTSVANDRDFGV